MKPVDVTSESQLKELDDLIKIGPVTFVFVYADWCGHCQRFKPTMDKLENTPGRTIQTARVRDDVYSKSSLAHNAIEGYPTVMLVKPDGNAVSFKDNGKVTNSVPDYTNEQAMTAIVKNAGTNTGIRLLENDIAPTPENMNDTQRAAYNNTNMETSVQNMTEPAFPANAMQPNMGIAPPNSFNDRIFKENIEKYGTENIGRSDQYRQNPQAVQMGGSLYNTLYQTAYHLAPVAGLYIGARYVSKKRSHKTRKGKKNGKKNGKKTKKVRGRGRKQASK